MTFFSQLKPHLRHARKPARIDGWALPSLVFDGLATALNGCGTLLIGFLMLLVNADVFRRAVLNTPIAGVAEFAALSIAAIVFLQLTHCVRDNQLTRSDSLLARVHGRRPRLAVAADGLYHLTGAILFTIIAAAVGNLTWNAYGSGDFSGVPGVVMLPIWPMKAIITLGSALAAVQFLRMAYSRFRLSGNVEASRKFRIAGGIEF